MKKTSLLCACLLMLCGAGDLALQDGSINVKSENSSWDVSVQNASVIRAYQPEAEVELMFNVAELLPNSPQCVSYKRIKDIKFSISIYKVAQNGDFNWARSFEQTRIRFSGHGRPEERKPYGSNLIKNNTKVSAGQAVNIGSLYFLSPYTCQNIWNTTFRITDMKNGGRGSLPPLEFTIIPPEDK